MPSVLYTLIAAGDRILVDHTNPRFTGNFRSTAAKLLYKAQNTGKEDTSFNLQGHVFSFRCACDAWFCAVSDEGYGKQMPFVFLKDVADTFAKQFTDVGSLTDSLVKAQFGEKLVAKVDQYSSADDSDKVATAQNNLDDLRVIISDNVNLAVERNMDLNDIADSACTSFRLFFLTPFSALLLCFSLRLLVLLLRFRRA
jgi:vesicle-associated membrane protein 7